MIHPSLKHIQDYFENEIKHDEDVQRVQKHLDSCDRCSLILSEMAKVDILVAKNNSKRPSASIKLDTLNSGFAILAKKRAQADLDQKRKDRAYEALKGLQNLKQQAMKELTIPLLQTAVICIILTTFVSISSESSYTEKYEIIPNEVGVFTSDYIGENNEAN